jgi:acetoin utilization deacetylase AcuC-like enzyme
MQTPLVSRRTFVKTLGAGLTAAAAQATRAPYASSRQTETNRTGLVYDSRYLQHEHYTEKAIRLETIRDFLQQTGLAQSAVSLSLLDNPVPHITRVHTDAHHRSIAEIPVTGEVARLAVAGVLGAARAVADGTVDNAFCAIRPPGHHVVNEGGESGFCFYANAAIAARYIQEELGYAKVLIIDWDYHHGNGTQYFFYDDPSVLFFSTHNADAYPGRYCNTFESADGPISIGSDPSCIGYGRGEGYTINVHLGDCYNQAVTDEHMLEAWDTKLLPAVSSFKPDFIVISAGFDSREQDYLGCFDITDSAFVSITRKAMALAREHCDGRLVSILEGGYNPEGLANAVCAHVATLMNVDPPVSQSRPGRIRRSREMLVEVRGDKIVVENAARREISEAVLYGADGRRASLPIEPLRRSGVLRMSGLRLSPGRYFVHLRHTNGADAVAEYFQQ